MKRLRPIEESRLKRLYNSSISRHRASTRQNRWYSGEAKAEAEIINDMASLAQTDPSDLAEALLEIADEVDSAENEDTEGKDFSSRKRYSKISRRRYYAADKTDEEEVIHVLENFAEKLEKMKNYSKYSKQFYYADTKNIASDNLKTHIQNISVKYEELHKILKEKNMINNAGFFVIPQTGEEVQIGKQPLQIPNVSDMKSTGNIIIQRANILRNKLESGVAEGKIPEEIAAQINDMFEKSSAAMGTAIGLGIGYKLSSYFVGTYAPDTTVDHKLEVATVNFAESLGLEGWGTDLLLVRIGLFLVVGLVAILSAFLSKKLLQKIMQFFVRRRVKAKIIGSSTTCLSLTSAATVLLNYANTNLENAVAILRDESNKLNYAEKIAVLTDYQDLHPGNVLNSVDLSKKAYALEKCLEAALKAHNTAESLLEQAGNTIKNTEKEIKKYVG